MTSTATRPIKNFSRALYLLDRSSTDSWSIEFSRFSLNSFLTDSQSIKVSGFSLDSFLTSSLINRAKFLCFLSAREILDRSSIHQDLSLAINRFSTNPRQILFCRDLVPNRFSIEILIHWAAFSIYNWGAIQISFLSFYLNRSLLSLDSNLLFSLKSFHPSDFRPNPI